jgi:Protein involved in formate dehydrogenase formation
MKPAQTGGPDYDGRIRRAQHLASAHPFASEVLTFYQQIATFQKTLYRNIARDWGNHPVTWADDGQFRSELKLEILLPHFPELLSLLEGAGPQPVGEAARRLAGQRSAEWIALLRDFWSCGGRPAAEGTDEQPDEPLAEFVARAFLQPYCEFVAGSIRVPQLETTYRACPRCRSEPLLGVLRPEGDGGKRYLQCSFCLQEWEFRRIFCAACREDSEGKLPVYVAEQFPHIRVEACDTCKSYVRTIDLTKNGHAVPVVDDLAAIPLSLWAHEHGYTRIQANLLGT